MKHRANHALQLSSAAPIRQIRFERIKKIISALLPLAGIPAFFIRPGVITLVIFIVLAVCGCLIWYRACIDIRTICSDAAIHEALNRTFTSYTYEPLSTFTADLIQREAELFSYPCDASDGHDRITAVSDGIELAIGMVELYKDSMHCKDDESDTLSSGGKCVFLGPWIEARMGTGFGADIVINDRSHPGRYTVVNEVSGFRENFHQRFRVYSDGGENVREILTDRVMDAILALDEKWTGRTHLHFTREGRVYIAINAGHELFLPCQQSSDIQRIQNEYVAELDTFVTFLRQIREDELRAVS